MKDTLKILFLVFNLVYVFYLPGYLITGLAFKEKRGLEAFALSLGLCIALIPIILFGAALLIHTTLQKSLILIVVTIINLTLFAILKHSKE